MVSLIIWSYWLIFLVLICFVSSRRMLLTPQSVFICGFIPQVLFSFYFIKKWRIELSSETLLVLVVGTGLFVGASILFQHIFEKYDFSFSHIDANSREENRKSGDIQCIEVEKWKLFLFLVFQVVSFVLFIAYLQVNVLGRTIFNKITTYNLVNKLGNIRDAYILPRWISWPRTICSVSSYVTGYMLVHSKVLKYKNHTVLLVINVMAGVANSIVTGGRMEAIGVIVALLIQAYIIWGTANGWQKEIRIKSLIKILIAGVILLALFQVWASIMGRKTDIPFIDYLGIYISAPLKNLDTFVRTGHFGSEFGNWVTLMPLITYLGRRLNIPALVNQKDLPFQTIGSYKLGNVYTCFYCYLHDGGYLALIGFSIIGALLAQIFWKKAVSQRKNGIDLSVIMYSYVLYTIALSFFTDRIFTSVISTTMLRTVICWWLLKWFFTKISFGHRATPNEKADV